MTIVELIRDAFREGNLISVGDSPTGAQYTEAERILLTYITSLSGTEYGEDLATTPYESTDQTIPPNSRLLILETSPSSYALPLSPNNGQRVAVVDPRGYVTPLSPFVLSAEEGAIDDAAEASIESVADGVQWFYREDKASWVRVSELISSSTSPFPSEFDTMLVLWLSIRLGPRYGVQTRPESFAEYSRLLTIFKSRYRQKVEVDSEDALVRLSSTLRQVY